VLLEGTNGVGGWREGVVEELERSIGDSSDGEGVVGLGPAAVVDGVGGVEEGELGDDRGGREQFEHVQAAVAEDAVVLRRRRQKSPLEERAESHRVTRERRLESWHRPLIAYLLGRCELRTSTGDRRRGRIILTESKYQRKDISDFFFQLLLELLETIQGFLF
jgi:hypothetical protein